MIRKLYVLLFITALLLNAGCIKETYNMDKVSGRAELKPAVAFPVLSGDMTFADIVKKVDTVVYDNDRFATFIFRQDSVIDFTLSDFLDFSDMVSFNEMFVLSDLTISPFEVYADISLDQLRKALGNPLSGIFNGLDGTTAAFPAFPPVDLGKVNFPQIPNLENAVFQSGYLIVTITNDLTAPLKPVTVQLLNTQENTDIGNELVIDEIPMGETRSDSIDLTDATMKSLISAQIQLSGSDGNPDPFLISLDSNHFRITVRGSNMKIKSGRVILPPNKLTAVGGSEVVRFSPGEGIEIDSFRILTGDLSMHFEKPASLNAKMAFSLPELKRNGEPLTQTLVMGTDPQFNTTMSFSNTAGNLGSDPDRPFNSLPYTLSISSSGMIDILNTDVIRLELKLSNPGFDFVKGYFGQEQEVIDPETIDLEFRGLDGDLFIADPSVKISYRNSFAVPVKVDFNVNAENGNNSVQLGLDPFVLAYPESAPQLRDSMDSIMIDNENSNISDLIALPPEKLTYSGSAGLNPEEDPSHLRNNYVFGNSRIIGDIEIEMPMELGMNVEFTDTVDNFMTEMFSEDSDPNWNDIDRLSLGFRVTNGFPVGLELKIDFVDSTGTLVKSLASPKILEPAPVGGNGKVTGPVESAAEIVMDKAAINSAKVADKIAVGFKILTTGGSNSSVKMYSDYHLDFKAIMNVAADITINSKEEGK